jgi:hypothetical protein
MQTVFGCGVATCKFAMGSNEPLGQPTDYEPIDLEADPTNNRDGGSSTKGKHDDCSKGKQGDSNKGKHAFNNKGKNVESTNGKNEDKGSGKRKRVLNEDDAALLQEMTEAVAGLTAAISQGNHAEAALGIYQAVMGCPNYARPDLMTCLNYLMENKATPFVFVGMSAEDKELWINTHLAKVRSQMAFQ